MSLVGPRDIRKAAMETLANAMEIANAERDFYKGIAEDMPIEQLVGEVETLAKEYNSRPITTKVSNYVLKNLTPFHEPTETELRLDAYREVLKTRK